MPAKCEESVKSTAPPPSPSPPETSDAGPPVEGCNEADLDGDNDVDQSDFGLWQRCYGGTDVAVDPNCDD